MAELSERLGATEETIVILKREVTNTCIGVSTSKPKVPEPKSFDRARSSKELENFCGTWSNTLVLQRSALLNK
jgi:hypothetical protein